MGVVLSLYCSSPGAQCFREELTCLQAVRMVRSLSYMSGIPLLYFKVGPHIYMSLAWTSCPPGGSSLLSVGGSRFVGREWRSTFRLVFLGDGSSRSSPIPVGRDDLLAQSGLGGHPVIYLFVLTLHVLFCAPEHGTPVEGRSAAIRRPHPVTVVRHNGVVSARS